MNHSGIAEYADVAFDNIEEVNAGENRLLRIKGLIFHSSVIADHIELHHQRDSVQILVSMALTRPGGSGSFDIFIPIPQRIAAVTFGMARKPIWERESERQEDRTGLVSGQHTG